MSVLQGGNFANGFQSAAIGIVVGTIAGKLTRMSRISRQFASLLKGSGVQRIVACSQGATISTSAMRALATNGELLTGVEVTFNRGAVNYARTGKVVRSVGGRMTPTSSNNIHTFDTVPNIAGLNTLNPVRVLGSILMLPTFFMGPEISQQTIYTP